MKLQKENKFKQMVVSGLSKAAIIAGIGVFGFSFLPNFMSMIETKLDSNKQTEIVTQAINPEYEEEKQNLNLEENYYVPQEFTEKYDFQKLKEIKYIAVYITKPVQMITHYAKVACIKPSCDVEGKYDIEVEKPIELGHYISLGKINSASTRAHKYTLLSKLKLAREYKDL